MQIKYPSWLPKFFGSTQTAVEMNQVIDVIQNHAENLSRHYRLILTNVGGIYPDIILPNSPFPEGITQAVFLVGPGTYINFGNLVVPNNNVGLIFYYDETFDLSLVPLETYNDTPLRNRITALEDKNGGEIAQGNNKNITGGQVYEALENIDTGGAETLLELTDVDATTIPTDNFLVGKGKDKAEFRKLHVRDMRLGAGYESGEYAVSWNYRTNNWGSGALVTTLSIENSIAKRDARGRLIAEAGTSEKHLINYGQLPFKLFETENEAQFYLLGGLAKYGQLVFVQTGPQKGRMLQVNENVNGYNTLFDYELNLSSLTDMNDFPSEYSDAAGKVLMVNSTSSGVEFKSVKDIDGIATYDENGNLTATEATSNNNVPTLGQVLSLLEDAPDEVYSYSKEEIDLVISRGRLIPNTLYEISGCDADLYGGTTLYLRAVTNNELEINGIGKFYNPKYNQEVDGYGIYDVDEIYKKDDTTIWGGRKWICKATTANEEPIDQFTLDSAKWNVVPYNDTEYNVAFDEIKYDYANDWISERHEVEGGNIVSCSKATYDYDVNNGEVGYNAIKLFQWGNIYKEDSHKGLFANIVNESWFDCLNSKLRLIYNNSLYNSSYIIYNTLNNGHIIDNTLNKGRIEYNTLNSENAYINGNTLNSYSFIAYNILNSPINISFNTLNSGNINFGTITTSISYAVFTNSSSAPLGATAKTILSEYYSKEVKTNATNQTVIQYINESNQLTIVPITS